MKTNCVAKISGASLRQLQWWDEQGYIVPAIDGHERIYTCLQCTQASIMFDLRKRGIPLRYALRIVRAYAKNDDANWVACGMARNSKVHFASELQFLAGILPKIRGPVYVHKIRHCTEEPPPLPRLQRRVRTLVPRTNRPAHQSHAPSIRNRISAIPDVAGAEMAAAAAELSVRSHELYAKEEELPSRDREAYMVARAEVIRNRLAGLPVGARW